MERKVHEFVCDLCLKVEVERDVHRQFPKGWITLAHGPASADSGLRRTHV